MLNSILLTYFFKEKRQTLAQNFLKFYTLLANHILSLLRIFEVIKTLLKKLKYFEGSLS